MDPDRLKREREFFDASSSAQFTDAVTDVPTEHMVALLDMLGDVRGKGVLDCGCGAGELAIEIARRGGAVVGFDLSLESVRLMDARAQHLGVTAPGGLVTLMETLPFPDGTFDAVVGKSILHHVDVASSFAEVKRVLRPGGRAIFVENQVTNPLLRFARNRLTGRFGIARVGTIDEHPLVAADYASLRRALPGTRLHYPDFRFFGLISRNVLRYRRALWLARVFAWLDRAVYRWIPPLRRYGYHVIIEARTEA
ncbi:MAG TPA: class I SAM-dependent methyltransferase [Actinomycetota bacterium]